MAGERIRVAFADLLWRTRGLYWDHQTIATPDDGDWFGVLDEAFSGRPVGWQSEGLITGGVRPFLAFVQHGPADRPDAGNRPIRHQVCWFVPPADIESVGRLYPDWPERLLAWLSPAYDRVYGLDDGTVALWDIEHPEEPLGQHLLQAVRAFTRGSGMAAYELPLIPLALPVEAAGTTPVVQDEEGSDASRPAGNGGEPGRAAHAG